MTFNSWEFLLFYPIVAALYFLMPKRMKWPILLIASYFFYMCYQAELVFLIFGTTLISWVSSMLIERSEKTWVRKLFLSVTLIASLGVLFFYKYFNFLSASVFSLVGLFGVEADPIILNLVLPVGISFYTFQTLSYVIDVYRGDIKTEKNFFFYALFVSFFPQLVAGPIERPGNLIPQLKEAHSFNKEDALRGAKYMILGFFKKVCVADMLAVYVNAVYNDVANATSWGIVIATLLFAVQIYCDFSGYTDIAIGCARVMGIRLMKNFDHPYSATSIKEFWSRWHISLSSWFKDYLYIPLGGNRVSKPRHYLNIMIVFLVSGLWHGANWTFVIWGALHGLYQIIGSLTIKKRNAALTRVGLRPTSFVVVIVRRLVTIALVSFAWLFFRANSISDAFLLLGRLFTDGTSLSDTFSLIELDAVKIALIIVSCLILFFIDRMVVYGEEKDASDALVRDYRAVLLSLIILVGWALLLSMDMESTFIYFQF